MDLYPASWSRPPGRLSLTTRIHFACCSTTAGSAFTLYTAAAAPPPLCLPASTNDTMLKGVRSTGGSADGSAGCRCWMMMVMMPVKARACGRRARRPPWLGNQHTGSVVEEACGSRSCPVCSPALMKWQSCGIHRNALRLHCNASPRLFRVLERGKVTTA